MPFEASTAQNNDALPVYAHLPPRSGLVQRFLSLVNEVEDGRQMTPWAGSAKPGLDGS